MCCQQIGRKGNTPVETIKFNWVAFKPLSLNSTLPQMCLCQHVSKVCSDAPYQTKLLPTQTNLIV